MLIVTSMSERGRQAYGERFLSSIALKDAPSPLAMRTYSEDVCGSVALSDQPEWRAFMDRWGNNPFANGQRDRGARVEGNYRYQAVKFCHKVFAYTDPSIDDDWLIWIDADVEFTRPLDERFFNAVLKGPGVYLGRKDWHHSECGFMTFRLPECRPFLNRMREMYTSGEIFSLPEWHDSYVFDHVRKELDFPFVNLSEGVPGTHVWPGTILGDYMVHNKGPVAKKQAYGVAA